MENTISKRLLSFAIALIMVLGMVPFNAMRVLAADAKTDIDLSQGAYTVETAGDYIVSNYTGANTLTVQADANITLEGVNITAPADTSAISIVSGNVTLNVTADSTLTGGDNDAGIYVAEAAALTVKGGKLTAIGNNGTDDASGAAGIGGTWTAGNSGSITIDGAVVTAMGYGAHGSGIGSGSGEAVGEIKIINGSEVTAQGGYYVAGGTLDDKYGKTNPEGGAAIGGGGKTASTVAPITISNSKVTAYGGSKAAGIGANFWSSVEKIDIDASEITAYGGASSAGIGTSRAGDSGVSAVIEITDSTVNATGGHHGAGIGCGYNGDSVSNLPETTITIDGNSVVNATGVNGGAGIGGGYKTNNVAITIADTADVTATAGILNDGSNKTIDQTCASAIGSGANGSGSFVGGTVTIEDTAKVTVNTVYGGKAAIEGGVSGENITVNVSGADLVINTAAELRAFAEAVNGGDTYSDKVVLLGADIDLAGSETNLWTPIGPSGDSGNKFYGTFDGQGHTIKNLYVKQDAAYHAAGLFGATCGTVKNLTIDGAYVESLSSGSATVNGTAVLAGSTAYGATIENVHVKNATVKGNRYVAGIVGYMDGSVIGCSVEDLTLIATPDDLTGSYDNGDKVGGIVGYCNSNAVEVSGCELKGTVSITAYRDVAGVVGCASTGVKINNNTNSAALTITVDQITNSYGEKTANASEFVGRNTPAEATGNTQTEGASCNITEAEAPSGTITFGYTRTDGVWGEAFANASESFYVELYVDDTKIATTQLNNIGGIIDGDVYVTWSIPFAGSVDEYWTVTWEEGYPDAAQQPTKVVLYCDGEAVAENAVQMNAPDDLNPVVWEDVVNAATMPIQVTYADGTVEYFDDMLEAVPYKTNYPKLEGATIKLLKDVTGKGIRFMETGMVLDLNGHTFTINNATGSSGTNTSGFQIRADAAVATIKNGTIQVAAPEDMVENTNVVWMFNSYSANFIVEDVTVDCANMAYSYGSSVYTHVSRSGDNTQFLGDTKFINFNSEVAGAAINVGGTMTIADTVVPGGSIELDSGAALTAAEGLDVSVAEDCKLVYAEGTYTAVPVTYVAQIGDTKYETLAEAFTAAQDGDEVVILSAGTYTLSISGKDITITGAVDGVVFDNIGKKNMGDANVTFNNVTFDYYPNVNYTGLQHSGALVYNNCTFNGQVFLYGTSETFNDCTFNQDSADAYNVWTYSAKQVAFEGCTFNCAGKSVLIYCENGALYNEVSVTDCDFVASAPVEGKAAIEMDSSLTAGIGLTIDGETTSTGFGTGNVSGNSLWNNKKDNKTEANNDITVTVDGDVVLQPMTAVAKIGDNQYYSLAEALEAAEAETDIVIDLLADATLDITAWQNLAIGGDTTETITINGNGNTLTFNKKNSDWDHITTNNGAKLILNNMTITDSGYNNGPWNRYDLSFACPVELNNVTATKAIALKAEAKLTDVTVNEAGDNYAIWIQPNGQSVEIDGLTVTSAGRGIKIDDQYVDEAQKVTLSVSDATFTTNKKAAILVKSPAGADITLANVDISGVAVDTVNAVWNDEDAAAYYGLITVTGGTKAQEGEFVATLSDKDGNIIAYYADLAEALNACQSKQTVTLLADVDLEGEPWTPIAEFKGSFDGQNHTIRNLYVDNGTVGNAGLFAKTTGEEIKNLTIENAKVSGRLNVGVLVGHPWTTDYTNITVKGHVEVEGMAYVGGVGGKNAYGDWTDITVEVDDTSYVNANSVENGTAYRTYVGGVVGFMGEGDHTFQNITSNIDVIGSTCDVGGIVGIAHYGNNFINITCSGDVTNNSAEAEDVLETGGIAGVWMNSNQAITMTGLTFTGNVCTPNAADVELPNGGLIGAGYNSNTTVKMDGDVAAVNGKSYATLAEAFAAAADGDTVYLLTDVKTTGKITITKAITIDGNGYSIIADETATWYTGSSLSKKYTHLLGVNIDNVTLKNIVLDNNGKAGGINVYQAQNVVFDNVDIANSNMGYAALTVNASGLTVKTKLSTGNNGVAIDIGNGSTVTVDPNTVFETNNKTVKFDSASAAGTDLTGAVKADGTPYFAAIDNAYYYTEAQMNSRTTGYGNGLKLLTDATVTRDITLSGGTLDLNGNDLTVAEGKLLKITGNVTITGEGTVSADIYLKAGKTLTAAAGLDVTTDDGYKVVYENGVYTTVEIVYVAQIGETKYETIAEALAAAQDGDTVTVLMDVSVTDSLLIESNITLDLNGFTVSAEGLSSKPVIRVLADVTVTGGTVDGTTGTNSYAFIVGNSETAGTLNIADGTYKGVTSAVSITNGTANISGGTFSTAHDGEGTDYGAHYLLNCMDAAYKAGTAVYNITGGTFLGFNPENNAAEGAKTNFTAEGYGVIYDGSSKYTVAKTPELPTATVTMHTADSLVSGNAPKLTFAMNFLADDATEEQLAYYGNWYADFVLTVNKKATFNAGSDTADGYLAGQYDNYNTGWLAVPFEDVTLEAGQSLKIMEYAAELLGEPGLKFTYEMVYELVENFDCGIYFTPEFLAANPDLEVTLELRMYNNADETVSAGISELYTYTTPVAVIESEEKAVYFDTMDAALAAAQAGETVTMLTDAMLSAAAVKPGVTVDLNGCALTGDVIATLDINGGTYTTTMYAMAGGEGFLYETTDAVIEMASMNEITVKSGTITLGQNWRTLAGQKLTIAADAAFVIPADTTMEVNCTVIVDGTLTVDGEIQLTDPAASVKAAQGLNVTTELEGYLVEYIAGAYMLTELGDRVAQNTVTGAFYTDITDALDEAKSGQTVKLLQSCQTTEVYVRRGRTLDLNGFTLTAEDVAAPFASSYIIDSTDGVGMLKVAQQNIALNGTNTYLPVWTQEGCHFVKLSFGQTAKITAEGNAYLQFYIKGSDPDCRLAKEMADGAADNNVTIGVELQWKDSQGELCNRYFVYSEELVKKYATDWLGNEFRLTVTGLKYVTDLHMTVTVISTANEEAEVTTQGAVLAPMA